MGILDKLGKALGKDDEPQGKTGTANAGAQRPQATPPSPQSQTVARQEALQRKYQPVITAISREQLQLQDLRMQDNKLYIRAVATSEAAKNRIWDEIKRINPAYDDIHADITVVQATGDGRTIANTTFSQIAAPVASQGTAVPGGQAGQTYVVKAGDTLSKLAKQFYGDAQQYRRIFDANRNQLNDPDLIKVGQQLIIPPKP